jgi:hypothetical protein
LEKERQLVEAFREEHVKKLKETDAHFAADLDREGKKKATIQAEMARRELEAEMGSARAVSLHEAESRLRIEEQQEKEKMLSPEAIRELKQKVRDMAWKKWLDFETAKAAKAAADAVESAPSTQKSTHSLEEMTDGEREDMSRNFKAFTIVPLVKKSYSRVNNPLHLFSYDESA